MKTISHDDWLAEGKKRFGEDAKKWRFVCPSCKTEQTIQDLLDAGVTREDVHGVMAFSCIGRFTRGAKGCDWTLGGLLNIHEMEVVIEGKTRPVFLFADVPTCRVCGCTDQDCRQCIEKTGQPCHWVASDLCSACQP